MMATGIYHHSASRFDVRGQAHAFEHLPDDPQAQLIIENGDCDLVIMDLNIERLAAIRAACDEAEKQLIDLCDAAANVPLPRLHEIMPTA